MAQKRNNGLDTVKISFKYPWLQKQFEKHANELSYLYGKDIMFMGIRKYCFERLDQQDNPTDSAENDASIAFQNQNES